MESAVATLSVGHPDALHRAFSDNHSLAFAFNSVYWGTDDVTKEEKWLPSFRYVVSSPKDAHASLFRHDIPLKWRCLFEVIPTQRARHLYFDCEQKRSDSELDKASHDKSCWRKIRLLQALVTTVFR